jgi:isopenicillin N synthase-like dioxygenase
MEIPLVDFECFLNGDCESRKRVSEKLIAIVKEYGFVYLKNFGIPNECISEMFALSERFFGKPIEYKRFVQKSHETFCGYDGLEEEKLAADRPGDLKESYMIKRYGTPWPSNWDEFKELILSFHTKCYQLALEILRAFAIGLDLDIRHFDTKFNNGDVTLLRYHLKKIKYATNFFPMTFRKLEITRTIQLVRNRNSMCFLGCFFQFCTMIILLIT